MTQPFFTIVIPTRGRPTLFRDALVSALWQDFDDFEVVVSDNYNDSQTQAVYDEFKDDSRLRCFRTDRLLNMPEHWEFASQHASGQYVLILTDRSVLKQGALKTIHEVISSSETPVDVCSWRWSVYNDIFGRETDKKPVLQEGHVHRISSIQLLEDFSSGLGRYNKCMPRGLNSCYHNSFVQRIRDEYGSPFRPISPDYSLTFASLGTTRDVLFIDQALFVSQGLDVSNGTNAFMGKGSVAEDYFKSLGDINLYAHVPIKSPTVNNLIYEDFLAARERIGGDLKEVKRDWPGYFVFCFDELLLKKAWGHMPPDLLQSFFDEWERALSTFDPEIQSATKEKVRELTQPASLLPQPKSKQKISLATLCIDFIKWLIGRPVKPGNIEKGGDASQEQKQGLSVMELAGF